MTTDPIADPLWDALSGLPPVEMRESRDRRVRRRCYAVLAERRDTGRSQPFRVADLMVAVAVALYIVTMVTEAVRLLAQA